VRSDMQRQLLTMRKQIHASPTRNPAPMRGCAKVVRTSLSAEIRCRANIAMNPAATTDADVIEATNAIRING